MKKIGILLSVLFISSYALGQTSALTATITDSDTQTWNNGTWQIDFVPNANYNGIYTWNGVNLTNAQKTYSGTMNGSGLMSASIPDSSFIAPSGTQWRFTLCPNASAQCSRLIMAVTGASPNLSSQLSAGVTAPRFSGLVFSNYGYNDTEVLASTLRVGAQYGSVSQSCLRVYTGSVWACGSGGFVNPMTGVGDLILGGTLGAATRFAANAVGTKCFQENSSGVASWGTCGGAITFDAIGSGTNTTAAMVIGSGSSLTHSGTGTNAATSVTGTIGATSTFKTIAYQSYSMGVCQGPNTTSAALGFSYGATGTTNPVPLCIQGSTTTPQLGVAEFTATGQQLHGHFTLPPDLTANDILLVEFLFREETDTNTAHNEIFNFAYACTTRQGGLLQPTYSGTQATTTTTNVPAAITATGLATLVPTVTCAAGNDLYWVISLDASRTATGFVDLSEFDIEVQRSIITQ